MKEMKSAWLLTNLLGLEEIHLQFLPLTGCSWVFNIFPQQRLHQKPILKSFLIVRKWDCFQFHAPNTNNTLHIETYSQYRTTQPPFRQLPFCQHLFRQVLGRHVSASQWPPLAPSNLTKGRRVVGFLLSTSLPPCCRISASSVAHKDLSKVLKWKKPPPQNRGFSMAAKSTKRVNAIQVKGILRRMLETVSLHHCLFKHTMSRWGAKSSWSISCLHDLTWYN